MSNALGLVVVGGAGYYAYTQGWLDAPLAALMGQEAVPVGVPESDSASLTPASVVQTVSMTKEAQLLRANSKFVQPWAAKYSDWTEALMWQESRGNVAAMGPIIKSGINKGDRAHGCMQVMPKTAQHMFDIGYTELQPVPSVLQTAYGSIYFGTSYLQFLNDKYGGTTTWKLHAYNGGPGFGNLKVGSANYKQNQGYVAAIKARHAQITKGELV